VIVGARISRSGNAAAQDGDLQAAGQSVAVDAGLAGFSTEQLQRLRVRIDTARVAP